METIKEVGEIYRICTICKEPKTLDNYGKNAMGKYGTTSYCKPCYATYQSKHRQANPMARRQVMARHKFGKSTDYKSMYDAQNGLCAACFRPENTISRHGTPKWLAVDHDHVTGEVRALLCNNCNAALGYIGDDLSRAKALVAYLERYRAENIQGERMEAYIKETRKVSKQDLEATKRLEKHLKP